MAGFLSMLPGLMTSVGQSGILGKVADVAGNVLKDIGEGKVSSWGDFGKSLAAGGARALGQQVGNPPMGNQHERAMADVNAELLKRSTNMADKGVVMAPKQSSDVMPKMPFQRPGSSSAPAVPAGRGKDEQLALMKLPFEEKQMVEVRPEKKAKKDKKKKYKKMDKKKKR